MEYVKLINETVAGLPMCVNKLITLMVIGIKPIMIIVSDIANSTFLKWLTFLSAIGYLNNLICLNSTLNIKLIDTALITSSIKTYGIKSIIFLFPLPFS